MNKKSTRDAYSEFLKSHSELYVIDADLSVSTGTKKFSEKYHDHFFNVGCAEQNLIGVSCGLAYTGKTVFASTYSMFGMRAWEQIRNILCHDNLNVKLVFTHSGLSNFADGSSHQCLEDIALMRVLPNMTIISPCDAEETSNALEQSLSYKTPFYFRLRRSEEPVLDKPYEFQIGDIPIIKDGDDITIIATGMMVSKAVEAADILRHDGISARVLNMHTVNHSPRRVGASFDLPEGNVCHNANGNRKGDIVVGSALRKPLFQGQPVSSKNDVNTNIANVDVSREMIYLNPKKIGFSLPTDTNAIRLLDKSAIIQATEETSSGTIVTVEDHNINGGIGSTVAEILSENCSMNLIRLGISDKRPFGQSARTQDELLDWYGLNVKNIVKVIKNII